MSVIGWNSKRCNSTLLVIIRLANIGRSVISLDKIGELRDQLEEVGDYL